MSYSTLITGPERRRRWSEEQKLELLAEAFGPERLPAADWVILLVKTYDTAAAARTALALRPRGVVSLQNGLVEELLPVDGTQYVELDGALYTIDGGRGADGRRVARIRQVVEVGLLRLLRAARGAALRRRL